MLSRTERFLLVAFLVAAAIAFRVPRTYTEWPFDFMREVQLTSALAARNLWLTHYKKDLAPYEKIWTEQKMGRFIEPPVLPHLTAACYALAGREIPWVSSIFTSLFWLMSGLFVFRMATLVLREEVGALAATSFFLLTPFGILLSMSFQPESLMILGYIISIYALIKAPIEKSWKNALSVTTLVGFCALAKPGAALIPVYTTFWALGVTVKSRFTFFLNRKNLFFIIFTPIPSIVYMALRLGSTKLSNVSNSGDSFLGSLLSLRLLEQFSLLPTLPQYIVVVVGAVAFGFSVLSVILWSSELVKRVYGGLLLGYLVSSIVFVKALGNLSTYKMIATYYHWPLILPTALGVGTGVSYLFRVLRWNELPQKSRAAILGMSLAALVGLAAPCISPLERPGIPDLTLYQVLGHAIPKAERAVVLTPYLAQDARYYNWLITQNWLQQMTFVELMVNNKPIELELKVRMVAEKMKAHYLVLTNTDRNPLLSQLSAKLSKLPKVLDTSRVVVYDIRSWLPAPDVLRTAKDYLTQAEI